jgi:hypothetical protein
MTEPIAEQFAAIRAAMQERGLEKSVPKHCSFCNNLGWQNLSHGFLSAIWQECSNCHNPKGKPKP